MDLLAPFECQNRVDRAFDALQAALPALQAAGRGDFASSLVEAFPRKRWSDKQLYWAEKLVAELNAPAPEKVVSDFAPIVALFDRAKAHLKAPFILMASASGLALRLSIAGERSRNAGDLYIAGPGSWGDRAFYGRIDKAGRFFPGRSADGHEAEIKAAMAAFAADPAGEAARYGKLHGHCCFCNLTLSDGRSTDVGYGPVCADKWGLPWGSKRRLAA